MKLRVKNLSVDAKAKDILQLFRQFGRVRQVTFAHKASPHHRQESAAMVIMGNSSECKAAARSLNGRDFCGNYLVVEEIEDE